MTDLLPIRRALLSVWDKEGLLPLAQSLHARGVELLSTGGTLDALRRAGLPAVSVAEFTGHPEIFEGRVKTLHPRLEGALLFRRDRHAEEARALGIPPIDLVVLNLYPFEAVTADPACELDRALEHIDIGGPTMLRAAAKNHVDVGVVFSPGSYAELLAALDANGGGLPLWLRSRWARAAFAHVSAYDAAIAAWLSREEGPFPPTVIQRFEKVQDLRYGENPHQRAAFYRDPAARGPSLTRARQIQGKELSYNNLLDGDAALGLALDLQGAAAVIVKHGNPSGAASAPTLLDAYDRALACDPLSAFGGILAVTQPLDEDLVARIGAHFFEVILAPSVTAAARERLAAKVNLRVLEVTGFGDAPDSGFSARQVLGGVLVADWDRGGPEVRKVVSRRAPTDAERADLEFAWTVAKHVKSNAIVLAKGGATLGVGAGQMSRVDSAELAVRKAGRAGLDLRGAAMASDAFFPFRDGLDAAIASGCTAVIQPGGSKRDDEVIAAADGHGLAMIFTETRHFRH